MRITNTMLVNNSIADMNSNLQRMQKVQEQMTSGNLYQKPSDNPTAITRSLQLSTSLASNTQYASNISNTSSFLSTTDTALGQASDVLTNMRQLVVSAGGAAETTSDKAAIKDSMNQDIAQFSQIMNTSFGGKYIFGGNNGSTAPTSAVVSPTTGNTSLVYCDETGTTISTPSLSSATKMQVGIAEGVTVSYSATATDVIGGTISSAIYDLRKTFTNIVNNLDGNVDDGTGTGNLISDPTAAATALAGSDLTDMDTATSKVLAVNAQVGAMSNRMTAALTQNGSQNDSITNLLSTNDDTDITTATIQFASMQSVYLASLQVSAKIIQPTLMDYLTTP